MDLATSIEQPPVDTLWPVSESMTILPRSSVHAASFMSLRSWPRFTKELLSALHHNRFAGSEASAAGHPARFCAG